MPTSTENETVAELSKRVAQLESRRETWIAAVSILAVISIMLAVIAVGYGNRAINKAKSNVSTTGVAASKPPAETPATGSIDIKLTEFSITPSAQTVEAGQVTFNISNVGAVPHELLVFDTTLDPKKFPTDSAGNIYEEANGMNKISDGDNIDPGGNQTRVVDLSKPGKYVVVCNIAGHFKSGMSSTITVVAPASAPVASGSLDVKLREFSVTPSASTVKAGKVTFNVTNDGNLQHELLVFNTDLEPKDFPLDPEGNINEEGPGMNKISDGDNIDTGGTQTRVVDLSKPGKYVLVCNIAGHFKAGMFTTITVH